LTPSKVRDHPSEGIIFCSVGHGIQYANAASLHAGECVDILEVDQGDGWTRIQKGDSSTGFVPSTYLRSDSSIFPTKLCQIESGRF
jgi:uncharacterized protein YgiM (DUF1202 family)